MLFCVWSVIYRFDHCCSCGRILEPSMVMWFTSRDCVYQQYTLAWHHQEYMAVQEEEEMGRMTALHVYAHWYTEQLGSVPHHLTLTKCSNGLKKPVWSMHWSCIIMCLISLVRYITLWLESRQKSVLDHVCIPKPNPNPINNTRLSIDLIPAGSLATSDTY